MEGRGGTELSRRTLFRGIGCSTIASFTCCLGLLEERMPILLANFDSKWMGAIEFTKTNIRSSDGLYGRSKTEGRPERERERERTDLGECYTHKHCHYC